jgi:hypothetical protein
VEEPLGLVRGDAQPLVVQIEGFDSFVESLKRESSLAARGGSRRGEACPGVASKQLGEGARS